MAESRVQKTRDTHTGSDSWLGLRIAAEMLEDYQRTRIGLVNRAERGGVDASPYVDALDGVARQEETLKKLLQTFYVGVVPPEIRAWQAGVKGLGEHTMARLLGVLGHPRIAQPKHWEEAKGRGGANKDGSERKRVLVPDPPYERSISQLWSYCGVGDSTRRRKRGQDADEAMAAGSPRLRSLLFVISESLIKNRDNPYRDVYDEAKAIYADRVHAAPCVRCGPSGKPAPEGSPWSKAHQHAAALRKVAKEVLRDLWIAAGAIADSDSKAESP